MLGCPSKMQIPSKILNFGRNLYFWRTFIERNRIHSIELVEFYEVSAFGSLNKRMVVEFTIGVAFFRYFWIFLGFEKKSDYPCISLRSDCDAVTHNYDKKIFTMLQYVTVFLHSRFPAQMQI